MGAVKGMMGLQGSIFATGMTQLISVIGLGTSVGAWDFAGCNAAAATCGAGALDSTNTGYGLRVTYNRSKSTNINAIYRNWPWVPRTARDSDVELSLTKNF